MSKKKLLIIGVIVVLLGVLFLVKTKGTKPDDSGALALGTTSVDNDFVSALLGVQNVILDTDILSSAVFKSLRSSGAQVNSNPLRGRIDPFAAVQTTTTEVAAEEPVLTENPRLDNFTTEDSTTNLLKGVKIAVSKITSTTAVVSVTGLPESTNVSLNLSKVNGTPVLVEGFTYKSALQEYTTVVTGLSAKTSYTFAIANPELFSSISTSFQTK